jgi:hypothetical protein
MLLVDLAALLLLDVVAIGHVDLFDGSVLPAFFVPQSHVLYVNDDGPVSDALIVDAVCQIA